MIKWYCDIILVTLNKTEELWLISLGLGLVPLSLFKYLKERGKALISDFGNHRPLHPLFRVVGWGFFSCWGFCLIVFLHFCVEFLLSLPGVWPNSAATEQWRSLVKLKTFKDKDAFGSCTQEAQARMWCCVTYVSSVQQYPPLELFHSVSLWHNLIVGQFFTAW